HQSVDGCILCPGQVARAWNVGRPRVEEAFQLFARRGRAEGGRHTDHVEIEARHARLVLCRVDQANRGVDAYGEHVLYERRIDAHESLVERQDLQLQSLAAL